MAWSVFGAAGRSNVIAAHPEAELVALCDRDPQRLGVTSQAFDEERPDLFGQRRRRARAAAWGGGACE